MFQELTAAWISTISIISVFVLIKMWKGNIWKHIYIPNILLRKYFSKLFLLTYWDAVDLRISNKQVQIPTKKEKEKGKKGKKEGQERWGEEKEKETKKKKKKSDIQRSEYELQNSLRTGHRKNTK